MHIGHKTPQQFLCLTPRQNFYSIRSYLKWCNTVLHPNCVLQPYVNRPVIKEYHPSLPSCTQNPEYKRSTQICMCYNNKELHNMLFILRQCFRGFFESVAQISCVCWDGRIPITLQQVLWELPKETSLKSCKSSIHTDSEISSISIIYRERTIRKFLSLLIYFQPISKLFLSFQVRLLWVTHDCDVQ